VGLVEKDLDYGAFLQFSEQLRNTAATAAMIALFEEKYAIRKISLTVPGASPLTPKLPAMTRATVVAMLTHSHPLFSVT
jgi:hypothetical protein